MNTTSNPFDPKSIIDRPRIIAALTSDDIFWNIIDELSIEFTDDGCGFFANRTAILKSYREGNLYIQSVAETEQDCQQEWVHSHGGGFDEQGRIVIPAFCVYHDGAIDLIWTAKRWRCNGVAGYFMRHFDIPPEAAGL